MDKLEVYIILRNNKPVFATSLIQEFNFKTSELVAKEVLFKTNIKLVDDNEHRRLLNDCATNIIEMNTKVLNMVDKS